MKGKIFIALSMILFSCGIVNAEEPQEPMQKPMEEPVYHTVIKGDTLWDISGEYLKDPFKWPDVWKLNSQIRNPHLIFPGDIVRITSEGEIEVVERLPVKKLEPLEEAAPEKPVPEKPAEEEAPVLPSLKLEEEAIAVPPEIEKIISEHMKKSGFVTKEELEKSGVILRSKDKEKKYLHYEDAVYVSFKEPLKVNIGDRFTLFKEGKKVYHPLTGKYVGKNIEILGSLKVTGVADTAIEGTIEASYKEIEAGARLTPYTEPPREIVVVKARKEIKGAIVSGLEGIRELSGNDIVYIDRGSDDGLKEGNVLEVYREREKVKDPFKKKRFRLPPDTLGKALVVRTKKRSATVIVLSVSKEMRPGDLVKTIPPSE